VSWTRTRTLGITLALTAAMVPFATCSGASAAKAAAHTGTVTMDGTTYTPKTLTVKLGDSVVWTNKDPFPHTATSRSQVFDSKPIMPGKSFTFTPRTRGDFPYVCTLHPTMKGTVHVE
jgi:plastocyanin